MRRQLMSTRPNNSPHRKRREAHYRPPRSARLASRLRASVPSPSHCLGEYCGWQNLSAFTWRHLFRFAERLIVVGIRSVPRPSLGRRPLPHIA